MVSNASDDLPEPLGPVMTTSRLRGRDTLTFFRLCCAALVTTRLSMVPRSSIQFVESRERPCHAPSRARAARMARGTPVAMPEEPAASRSAAPTGGAGLPVRQGPVDWIALQLR